MLKSRVSRTSPLFNFNKEFNVPCQCLTGGGVLKLVRIKSLKKKITFSGPGFIVVVIEGVKIV